MQPNGPDGPNPYEFILSGNQAPRRGLSPGGLGKQAVIFLAIAIVIGLIAIFILFRLVLGGGESSAKNLLDIAQQQAEIIRIADDGEEKARSTQTRALAATTKLSLTTAQSQILELLKKQGQKPGVKELGVKKSTKTDDTLTRALQNNRYDEAFTEVIAELLTIYRKSLAQAYEQTASKKDKEQINDMYKQAGLLVGEKPASP